MDTYKITERATGNIVKTFEAPEDSAMTIAADWARRTTYDVGELHVTKIEEESGMWFVEFEGSKGWEIAYQTEAHELAMTRFEYLLKELNTAENRNEDSNFVAVRIEYRRA